VQTALNLATSGDQLVLSDGTYTGSSSTVLNIHKSITIRAQNAGQAVLDGENARRVVSITTGTINFQGLDITRGYAVCTLAPDLSCCSFVTLMRGFADVSSSSHVFAEFGER
jgi:hypothetical protein